MSNLGKLVRVTEQVRPDAYHANVAKLNDIDIRQVAPTILRALGVAIPQDIESKPLEVFK